MLKIFEKGNKVNFVDSDNRFVGYDLDQQCCEQASWFLTSQDPSLPGFVKDTEQQTVPAENTYLFLDVPPADVSRIVDGGAMSFGLMDKEGGRMFLVIYNAQNGYYSHGFEWDFQGQHKGKGSL